MPAISEQEKRTIRLGLTVLALGIVVAAGLWCARHLQSRRQTYHQLLLQAQDVRGEIDRYEDKADTARRLMDTFHLDPMTLHSNSVVAQASAAIQKACTETGVAAGIIRETPAHGSSREIATIQFEGNGPVPAITALLYQLERAGAPLVIDSVGITSDPRNPAAVKVNLTIIVLDFEQWKKEGSPNA